MLDNMKKIYEIIYRHWENCISNSEKSMKQKCQLLHKEVQYESISSLYVPSN